MKFADEKQMQEHSCGVSQRSHRRCSRGRRCCSGWLVLGPQRFPAYHRLPLSLKALGVIIVLAPCLSIQAERRGLQYERSQWEGEGLRVLDHKQIEAMKKWDSLSFNDKVGDWAFRHQYSLIMGSWAASLALAGAIISRQKYQTHAQKVVQARMWAQGLTVGLLIAAGALTQGRRIAIAKEGNLDHSWRDLIEQQERDRKEAIAAAAASAAH